MKSIIQRLALAAIACATVCGVASAALRLDIGFDPANVPAGTRTQFIYSVQNTSRDATVAELSVEFSFGDLRFGPFTQAARLGPGQGMAFAVPLGVPGDTPRGILEVHASARDRSGMTEDRSSLSVIGLGHDPTALCRAFTAVLSRIGFD